MHELSVTEGILRIAVDEGTKHNAKKVNRIKIKVGELTGLLPECISYYFDIISKNTIAEGAVLDIEKIPVKLKCSDCGSFTITDVRSFRCGSCGGQNLKIVEGNEFYVDSLEVD